MKKIIFGLIFALISVFAHAELGTRSVESAGFDALPNERKAEIIAMIASEKAKTQTSVQQAVKDVATVDAVDKWVTIGERLGKGLAGTAKELGIAANEFAQSPVGKMASFLIIWQMFGEQFSNIIFGVIVWLIGTVFVLFLAKRGCPTDVTYSNEQKNIFGNFVIAKVKKTEMSGEMMFGLTVIMLIFIIIGALMIKV